MRNTEEGIVIFMENQKRWDSVRKNRFKSQDFRKSSNFRNRENTGKDSEKEKPDNAEYNNTSDIYESEAGMEQDYAIIIGRNPVLEALKSGRTINKVMLAKGDRDTHLSYIAALAKERGIVVQEVDSRKIDKFSGIHSSQGVAAFVASVDYVETEDILAKAEEKNEPPFIVILDSVTDPQNLGSIIRTCDAAGVHGLIIPKRRSASVTPAVSKASAGAVEYVPVARVVNLVQTIKMLKEKGIWIAGAEANQGRLYYECDLKGPLAIVIGSEGEGMGRLVRENCDFIAKIPMMGNISSLNAGVAAAVLLFEALKQRSGDK